MWHVPVPDLFNRARHDTLRQPALYFTTFARHSDAQARSSALSCHVSRFRIGECRRGGEIHDHGSKCPEGDVPRHDLNGRRKMALVPALVDVRSLCNRRFLNIPSGHLEDEG